MPVWKDRSLDPIEFDNSSLTPVTRLSAMGRVHRALFIHALGEILLFFTLACLAEIRSQVRLGDC